MGSKRTFRQTTITFQVLSEEPIPADMSLEDILREATDGGYSGVEVGRQVTVLDGPQAATALLAMHSATEFFGLTDDGDDLDDGGDDEGRAAQDFALSLHNGDEVAVKATGQVVKVLGDPHLEGDVVMVPTVAEGGAYRTYPHTELR